MKRGLSFIIALLMVTSVLPLCGIATDIGDTRVVVNFEDGSYLVETIETIDSRASGTKSGSKIHSYYAADGSLEWKATLSGTFTYTGNSATCTSSSCSVSISNSEWYTISKSASKSGSSANASVTMGKKLLGVTVAQVPITITLTCDANGNLS